MSKKKQNQQVFVISEVEDLGKFYGMLSMFSRFFPEANYRWKESGRVSHPYQDLTFIPPERMMRRDLVDDWEELGSKIYARNSENWTCMLEGWE